MPRVRPLKAGLLPEIVTIRDQIYWSYANLARAHAALEDGASRYRQLHHIIRARMFSGLKSGKMSVRSLYDDERLKMTLPQVCVYCGSANHLSLDHMIPRAHDGVDEADNLVWACRSCNSSKNKRDMLAWMAGNGKFPSIFVLRRYLKIVLSRCEKLGILDEPLDRVAHYNLPFSLGELPTTVFPPLDQIVLWAAPQLQESRA